MGDTLTIGGTPAESPTDGPALNRMDGDAAEQVTVPFGLNAGGEDPVMVGDLEFVPTPHPSVQVSGDASASGSGEAVAVSGASGSIAGTENDTLYHPLQYGGNLSYEIAIENGTYDVTLYAVENAHGSTGSRVFDVSIEGDRVLEHVDIYRSVGQNAAFVRTIESVEVTDGSLSIHTTTITDNTSISGIAVRPSNGDDDDGGDGLPPVGGDSPPTDPDGDGRYEDVNGDGEVTYADVVDLFENFDGSAVQDNPDAYDFNGNGRLDFDDITALFRSL